MSDKHLLRKTRANTVINATSRGQEKEVIVALKGVESLILEKFPTIKLFHTTKISLKEVVYHLRVHFPDIDFDYKFDTSSMKPDGGCLYILNNNDQSYPILISEVKNQGTNDLRLAEGQRKQSKGNAIERLGKNVIGLRAYLLSETIFPFICFGYGCDFADDSSILDRVATIAMFGHLNRTYLHNQALFNRGSFYFKKEKWTVEEMTSYMYDIAEKSIYYYFSKYGEDAFSGTHP